MAFWLLKTEPGSYAWDDLARDKKTVWNGISNAAALKNLRTMNKGDQAFFYHTGKVRAIIGIADITSNSYPDPKAKDGRLAVIDLKAGRKLPRPVTLDEIKLDKTFAGWDLLHISRLSVVPVPEKMWDRIMKLADTKP